MNGREREPGARELEVRAVAAVPRAEDPERKRREATQPARFDGLGEYDKVANRSERGAVAKRLHETQRKLEGYQFGDLATWLGYVLTGAGNEQRNADALDALKRALRMHYRREAMRLVRDDVRNTGYDSEYAERARLVEEYEPEDKVRFALGCILRWVRALDAAERKAHPEHRVHAGDYARETVNMVLPMPREAADASAHVFEEAARTEWDSVEIKHGSHSSTMTLRGHVRYPKVNAPTPAPIDPVNWLARHTADALERVRQGAKVESPALIPVGTVISWPAHALELPKGKRSVWTEDASGIDKQWLLAWDAPPSVPGNPVFVCGGCGYATAGLSFHRCAPKDTSAAACTMAEAPCMCGAQPGQPHHVECHIGGGAAARIYNYATHAGRCSRGLHEFTTQDGKMHICVHCGLGRPTLDDVRAPPERPCGCARVGRTHSHSPSCVGYAKMLDQLSAHHAIARVGDTVTGDPGGSGPPMVGTIELAGKPGFEFRVPIGTILAFTPASGIIVSMGEGGGGAGAPVATKCQHTECTFTGKCVQCGKVLAP